MQNRTIFIGDIHGCYKEFKLLLKKLEIQKSDKVYVVGDMVHKGPKSYKLLKYLYKNQKQFQCIMGNHEEGSIGYTNEDKSMWNGHASEKMEKLKKKLKKNPKIFDFLKNLPYFIEDENFLMIHAGIINNIPIKEQDNKILTRIRNLPDGTPWYENYTGTKKIIYGHWATNGLNIRSNSIGLDSGCVYGNQLTAYILETGEIIQQQALKQYIKPDKIGLKEQLKILFNTKRECIYQALKNLKK